MDLDLTEYIYSMAALIFVIALISLAGTLARRMGLGFAVTSKKGDNKRLAIIEMKGLDAKRRLVLIRRDDKEHLILLGADSELLIESAISPPENEESPLPSNPGGKFVLAAIGKAVK